MSKNKTIPHLLKLKDYVTLTGTTLGVIALICAAIGSREFISLGFFLISITLGTDLLDGYLARKMGTVNELGKELDSLSDSLTFGIAPAILTFQAFKTGGAYDIVIVIGSICFALGGILRLARFNISPVPGYTGLPTPLSCLMLICFFYANYFYAFAFGGIIHPFPDISYFTIPILMILIGWFNITTYINFGKKGKKVYGTFLVLAPLCPIFGILGILNPNFLVSMIISIFFLVSFMIFILFIIRGFLINVIKKKKDSNSE
ncbi:MAG: CDP-alcohol phosphatidyltransferase family protein [Promethearchaeota archaeon]